ncbi:hypothetical protein MN116_004624 [Schistosoma mekongi]|uniref:EF-hand domain-containing protein n=1 Tax=Schistosoma mekongi TaxID=38744 RepID=A0AAE1ZDV2_SCHME|nr:hypothetical protein MN116_004624 [Schistosoma mekongi]
MLSAKKQKAKLTEETISEYKAQFDALDKDKKGKVPIPDITILIRKVGLTPSNLEIEELIADVDKEKTALIEGITFEQFCEIASRKYNDTYTESDIIEAFRTFDVENNGFLPASELRRALCTVGENLTEVEMEAMLDKAKVDSDGNVRYEEFVRFITSDF